MTERIKHGNHNSVAPFGYKIVDKQLVIFPEQAEIIREVYSRYLNGWGQKQIAAWLNTLGITTNRGGKIENRTVNYWLRNPVYHGYVRWNPAERASTKRYIDTPDTIIVKGHHEPIIDEETWEAVQKRCDEVRMRFSKHRRENIPKEYALSGVIKCSSCGASLSTTCGQKYLQCAKYAHGLCSTSHHVSYEMLWLMLLSTIEGDLTSGNFQLERISRPVVESDIAALRAQIERTEMKLRRIREAFEAGIDTLEEYKSGKARITAELESLRERAAEVNPTDREVTPEEKRAFAEKHLRTLVKLRDPEVGELEKNHLLKEFVKKATYRKADNSLSVIYMMVVL